MTPEDLRVYEHTRALQRLSYDCLHEYEINHLQTAMCARCKMDRRMNGHTVDYKAKWERDRERMIRKALGVPRYVMVRKSTESNLQHNG